VDTTCTVTDPTPAQGKGFRVLVRNGTATVGGVAYSASRMLLRYYHSGAWSTEVVMLGSQNLANLTDTFAARANLGYLMAHNRRVVESHVNFVSGGGGLGGSLVLSNLGGTTSALGATTQTDIGGCVFATGTAAEVNRRAAINTQNLNAFLLGACNFTCYFDIIPSLEVFDGTVTGFIHAGLTNTVGSLGSNGVYFYSSNGGNFFARSISGGTSTGTDTDTGIACTLGTRRFFEIRITDASEALFYIDDVLVATHTANIPTANAVGLVSAIVRTADIGTDVRFIQRYFGFRAIYNANRY
jgi:hypothetical protein